MKKRTTRQDPNQYPHDWDADRVRKLAARYDSMSDNEAVREDEAAWSARGPVVSVPPELLPAVRRMIAERARASAKPSGKSGKGGKRKSA